MSGVDRLQQSVEDQALRLLALRQPMAVDLRNTLSAIKIANELERIGDLAKNIGKRAMVLNREPPIKLAQSLGRMGRQTSASSRACSTPIPTAMKRRRRMCGAAMRKSTNSTTAFFASC